MSHIHKRQPYINNTKKCYDINCHKKSYKDKHLYIVLQDHHVTQQSLLIKCTCAFYQVCLKFHHSKSLANTLIFSKGTVQLSNK